MQPNDTPMDKQIIVVAGATGNLGFRIVKALILKGTAVRGLVRAAADSSRVEKLKQMGASIIVVNFNNEQDLATACDGAACIISALAGLRDVVIDTQTRLLNAAIAAGVPRFIPSDYSLDFTKFEHGENRNLDFRREFHTYLDASPIKATSIFNGAFMDMLTNEIPMIIFKKNLVLYWGNKEHKMHFTTLDDTAMFTANAALDPTTPRYLTIAGDLISPAEIRDVVTNLSGNKFRLIKTGGLGLLSFIIKIAKKMAPGTTDIYPAWQGMQYMSNMMDERGRVNKLDNARYPEMQWTTVEELLSSYPFQKK